LNKYIELDKVLCEKFGVVTGGVAEYINRLNNARFAPDREEVLPRLVRYRNVHKRFAYEPGAIRKSDDIVKDDIRWVSRFRKDVLKKRDPISKYLRKARRYAMRKKLIKSLVVLAVVLGVVGAIALVLLLLK
jgi:hypothetical protein